MPTLTGADPASAAAAEEDEAADSALSTKRRRLTSKGAGAPVKASSGPGKRPRLSAKASEDSAHIAGLVKSQPPDETDNERYFCDYALMYHQMDMLEDSVRTSAYFNAILANPESFKDKVVLDVGAGTCILAMMAARAGARRVFAVEATTMAERGRRLVAANGLSDIVQVVQGTLETAKLPSKVDVIVSEWMGFMLLRESMLDTVLLARDRYLKPGGALFPSHSRLILAPITNVPELGKKRKEWKDELVRWPAFAEDMKSCYGFDFACTRDDFMQEQRKYYLQTSILVALSPTQLLGFGVAAMELDLLQVQLSQLQAPSEPSTCTMHIVRDGLIEGFCGYFDASFRGSPENPVEREITLQTEPTNGASTHWGQQAFMFEPPLDAKRGDTLTCTFWLRRQKRNHRLLEMECRFVLQGKGAGRKPLIKEEFSQYYYVD
mmetsp:Transcript_44427/g.81511  ORF Transcript_44427/g.81511 Transcript_44427/m.81511 type:complete len:436 (-) Transcript_44427:8-1315(-)